MLHPQINNEQRGYIMKKVRILSFVLARVMTVVCCAACSGSGNETQKPVVTMPSDYVDDGTVTNTENRQSVKDTVPTDLDFTGKEMVFFVRDDGDFKIEMDVEKTTNDTLSDAVFYRNTTVEDRLGVEIKQVAQNCNMSTVSTWNSTLRNSRVSTTTCSTFPTWSFPSLGGTSLSSTRPNSLTQFTSLREISLYPRPLGALHSSLTRTFLMNFTQHRTSTSMTR